MTAGISESRFNMWRAVVALVHADNEVTQEERDLVENYIRNISFSEEQKSVLREDLEHSQDIGEIFSLITAKEDQAEFFDFARVVSMADGTIDQQEEEIFEKLKSIQMGRINEEELRQMVRSARKAFDVARLKQEEDVSREAKDLASLTRIFSGLKRGNAA